MIAINYSIFNYFYMEESEEKKRVSMKAFS
jgi:hypothetical protein